MTTVPSSAAPGRTSYDALIAATALSQGLLFTRPNAADYRGIDGLVVVEVPPP